MPNRGTYQFAVQPDGRLVDNADNLERLRRLFRDGKIVHGLWGPSDYDTDFAHGAWHILCHLAGGSGVLRTKAGPAWCGITHTPVSDTYHATLTFRRNGAIVTIPLGTGEGAALAMNAECLGFIEGSSLGHISARGVTDPPEAFGKWPRQAFDQPPDSVADGGVVWEHWSTTRDIRATSVIGSSVLQAYLTLVALLGGRFVAAVARGRRQHNHPEQLVALVQAGLLTTGDATWDVMPDPIGLAQQLLLYEARPVDSFVAAAALPFFPGRKHYFMYPRRICEWSPVAAVRRDLAPAPTSSSHGNS